MGSRDEHAYGSKEGSGLVSVILRVIWAISHLGFWLWELEGVSGSTDNVRVIQTISYLLSWLWELGEALTT